MTSHAWKPLGMRGTIRFFFRPGREPRVASWRHFGWELEVELGRSDYSARLGRRPLSKDTG